MVDLKAKPIMKLKKVILSVACLSLTVSLLGACGSSSKSSADSSKETAVSAEDNKEEKATDHTAVSKETAESGNNTEGSEKSSTEKDDTEKIDTEKTDTEKIDTEKADTEKADTESSSTENVYTETEDSGSTENSNTETMDSEENNSEMAESQTETISSSEDSSMNTEAPDSSMIDFTDEHMSDLMEQLTSQLPVNNGEWSVYVCDLNNGYESFYQNHAMQSASLIKLYIMGAIYEDYDNIIATYGKENVDNNLYNMITVSDNDAANTLTNYLGGGNDDEGMRVVTSFCQEHGFVNSSMGRLLLHSNEFGDNYTSVVDCGRFLKAIRENNTDEFPHAEDMFNLLAQQQVKHKIPSQLPEGVRTANKTGELDNVENDAGIIYDVANEVVLVFMSQNLTEVGNAQTSIGSLSRLIYDYYNSQN